MDTLSVLLLLAVAPFALLGIVFLISWILFGRYVRSEEFLRHKLAVGQLVEEHNAIATYVKDIRAEGTFRIGSSAAGVHAHFASFDNTSRFNYRRDRNIANYEDPLVHNCSLQVVRNAKADPLKYVIKYFGISADERGLAEVESLGESVSRLENAIANLESREASIASSVRPPAYVLMFFRDAFMKQVGVELSPIKVPYPEYKFEYVSAGGNSSQESKIKLDAPKIDALIEMISGRIRFRRSVAGQRALMTRRLRESIKARDNYACRNCMVSLANEPNLLLEVDHIVPISRGGLTAQENLQTLCWRCNRSKSNRLPI